jgi:hypothetical protein
MTPNIHANPRKKDNINRSKRDATSPDFRYNLKEKGKLDKNNATKRPTNTQRAKGENKLSAAVKKRNP